MQRACCRLACLASASLQQLLVRPPGRLHAEAATATVLQVCATAARIRQRWVRCCCGNMLHVWTLEAAVTRLLTLLLQVLRMLWERRWSAMVERANGRHCWQRGAELGADRLCRAVVLVQVLLL